MNAGFAPLAAPTPVAVGDVLRTDATGYAEVAYHDGSRTRLVRVVALTRTAAEMIDGAYVVTSFDARNELTETVTEGFCTFGDFASREEIFQGPPYLGYIAVLVGSAQR